MYFRFFLLFISSFCFADTISFTKDIKPILDNRCVVCVITSYSIHYTKLYEALNRLNEKVFNTTESSAKMIEKKDRIIVMIKNISSVSEETAASSQEVSTSILQQSSAVEEISVALAKLKELSAQLA